MTRPLKIKYSGATAIGLQEMTDAELDYVAHQVCANIAAQTSGTGPLTLNVNGATGTSIGTFVDTYRPDAVGSHPVGTTINSVTTTFKQVLTTDATAPTRPLEWSSSALRENADASLNSYIFNRVLTRLATPALGSYVLQPSAPATGTWTAIATITDTAQSGNTTTKLWRCTAYTAPTAVRPVKIYGTGMREMTDAELQTLFGKYTSYVNTSGPGKYAVQSAAPTTGTWVRMGSAFSDTIQQVANQNYTGSYSANYTGSYTGYYAGSRPHTYTGYYTGSYSASYATAFTGFYSGYVRGYYTGYFAGSRSNTYTGYYTGSYASTYSGTYTGYYAGSRSHTYTGLTVISTKDTPSNISLWLRTA